ncbi:cytochrome c oxidase subunit II [Halococcus sediminicola]|uniref:cytochrome c oxidase subunit II n=1 Tax=Halococcus sediminicola TaxID=1264579 RepID=UPI000678A45F|nr:cytochrome c oxidase subunit II [Halococcus sediminicola]
MNKTRLGRYALLAVGLVFVATEPVLAQSVNADLIYELNAKLLYVAIPITLLVQVILVYTVWRFRNNDDPQPTRENRRLEITWTLATAIILLFVGIASYTVLGNPAIALTPDAGPSAEPQAQQGIQPAVTHPNRSGATAPETQKAIQIEIDAYQWGWEFIYPKAGVNSSSELVIPANKPVYLHITSRDVIHAVHVPTLGLKQDAIPGQYNTIKTNATKPGSYQLYCAEFCGSGHSKMLANMTVMPQGEYQSWLDEQKSGGSNSSASGSANSSAIAPVAANPA